jgi:transposase-like protein
VDHVTVYRWVLRFTPLLADAARPCRHTVGNRWQVDETYVRVAGRWRYVYRAIDQFGQVVDVLCLRAETQRPPGGSLSGPSARTKVTPAEISTDQASVYPVVLEDCCQRHGTAPSGTPITVSRQIMVS